MGKEFSSGQGDAPKVGISALLSPTVQQNVETSVKADNDPEAYELKSYYIKRKHINTILNLVHMKRMQGDSLIGQKEILDAIFSTAIAQYGHIPERPDAIKAQEKMRGRKSK